MKCNNSRDVIRLLGTFAIIGLMVIGLGMWVGKPIDAALFAVVGAAIGNLGSILSRPTSETQQVHVDNKPSDPVPTTEAG